MKEMYSISSDSITASSDNVAGGNQSAVNNTATQAPVITAAANNGSVQQTVPLATPTTNPASGNATIIITDPATQASGGMVAAGGNTTSEVIATSTPLPSPTEIPDAVSGTVPAGMISVLTYNYARSEKTNTINAYFKITNNHTENLNLSLLKIRYYYTPENKVHQNFWCDWSDVTGAGSSVFAVFSDINSELHYAEIGFLPEAGVLAPGASIVLQTRIAADDWSEYIQTNDGSFNSTATDYAENRNIGILY